MGKVYVLTIEDVSEGTMIVDIGGGTTNIVLFDNGEVVSKGCFDIGGRLIRLKQDLTVESVSPAAEKIARYLGIRLNVGQRTSIRDLEQITDKMADLNFKLKLTK